MRTIKQIFTLGLLSLCTWSALAGLPIQHWQTSSGSEVFFVENHDLPIIDISVNFAAGSSRGKPGIAGLTQHMLSLGAGGLNEEEISRKFADIGANPGGSSDADRATLTLRTLSQQNESTQALSLFGKILQQPDFPADVLEREKTRIIASLREAETQPESIANKAFYANLYPGHPYGRTEGSEPDTIAAIRRDDLVSFYQENYRAQGTVIALIGDMSREQATQIAETLSSGLPKGDQTTYALPPVALPEAAKTVNIPHPASQAHILLGYPGVKRGDPDYFPLYVGNYILGGGGFVSRLTEEVREKRGLAYSVYSYFMPLAEAGPFQIGMQTKRDQAMQSLRLVQEVLAKFIKEGPSAKELKAAKQNIIGGFPLRIDSNAKILEYLAVIGFYRLPLSYLDDFTSQIEHVTATQVRDAFARRIKPNNMVTIVVGTDAQ